MLVSISGTPDSFQQNLVSTVEADLKDASRSSSKKQKPSLLCGTPILKMSNHKAVLAFFVAAVLLPAHGFSPSPADPSDDFRAGHPDSSSTRSPNPTPIPAFDEDSSQSARDANATQVLTGEGNYFLKIDLQDSLVHPIPMLANYDTGGLQSLSAIKGRLEGSGYAEWAIINGDLFSQACPAGVNCGQGLTYISGQHKPNWSAYGDTWRVRGNIGFDSGNYPEVDVGDGQTKRFMTIAGGPRVLMNGGSPTCSGVYDGTTGKTYFPASGEYFDGDVRYWCTDTRAITAVGFSADHRYLYFGISTGGNTVTQVAQWLKDRGAYEVLRFDSGSSTGMYHNGAFVGGTGSKPIANALAVAIDSAPPISDTATVHEHAGFQGTKYGWHDEGSFNLPDYMNDLTSSIWLSAGWSARVFEHADLQGGNKCFNDTDSNLSDDTLSNGVPANDSVSSIEVFHQDSCPPQEGGSVRVVSVWAGDGNWTAKSVFDPGDPIQWIIVAENTTGAAADIEMTFEATGPYGLPVSYWNGIVTTETGTWNWGLPDTVPTVMGGNHTFKGTVVFEGTATDAMTTYYVTGRGPTTLFLPFIARAVAP